MKPERSVSELITPAESPRTEPRGDSPLLDMRGLRQDFGKVRALDGADFELQRGEVHALLGPNGAGKSTLVKVLAGVHQPDDGEVLVDGHRVHFTSPHDARDAGVGIVYQELSLIPSLSVAENIYLAREQRSRFGLLRRGRMRQEAERLCEQVGLEDPVTALVEDLPFAHRQLVEIAKALSLDARILVLDEPTSSLTPQETGRLFERVRRLKDQGVGVVYITHRLGEVFELSDRVTIMRDGRNAGTFTTVETDLDAVVRGIVGEEAGGASATHVTAASATRPTPAPAGSVTPAIRLDALSSEAIRGVSLEVNPGEIVGLAGLIGSGRSEILRAVFGIDRVTGGSIWLDGRRVEITGPGIATAHGLALVPEDRHEEGLVLDQSIMANIALPRLGTFSRRLGLRRQRQMFEDSSKWMKELRVKAPSPRTPVSALSGGNQQKVVFAKWLGTRPKVLMLDEPMVGVDVGAKEEIAAVVRREAQRGTAVLVVSSELEELLQLCTRIALVADGTVVGEHDRGELESEDQLHSMVQEASMLTRSDT